MQNQLESTFMFAPLNFSTSYFIVTFVASRTLTYVPNLSERMSACVCVIVNQSHTFWIMLTLRRFQPCWRLLENLLKIRNFQSPTIEISHLWCTSIAFADTCSQYSQRKNEHVMVWSVYERDVHRNFGFICYTISHKWICRLIKWGYNCKWCKRKKKQKHKKKIKYSQQSMKVSTN